MSPSVDPDIKHSDGGEERVGETQRTEERSLIDVSTRDPSPEARLSAVRKILHPHNLAEVVRKGKHLDARLEAVGRIEDQVLLAEVIHGEKEERILKAAFEGITDAKILARIAEDASYDIQARRIAIDSFAGQAFLEEVARNVDSPDIREAAINRLSEMSKAAETAAEKLRADAAVSDMKMENIASLLENYGSDRVVDAIGRFRGSKRAIHALGHIAREGKEGSRRAIHYLGKALSHSNPRIRLQALQELTDVPLSEKVRELLEKLKEDPDPEVRKALARMA